MGRDFFKEETLVVFNYFYGDVYLNLVLSVVSLY